jgi:hypothetical protein
MTSMELYKKLNEAGIKYEVIEIFEGVRLLEFVVDEENLEEQYEEEV